MRCLHCSYENLPGSRFCQSCGQPLQYPCPNCGTFNDPTAQFCRSCGISLNVDTLQEPASKVPGKIARATRPNDLLLSASRLEGERKPVTILFTDIVGSTSIAEKLDPEEWKAIVSGAHRIVSQAVRRYDGTIAQFLGDGVLAFFGAPLTHEDDPQRAVQAALDIQQELEAYRSKLRGLVEDFLMRIGLHSGLVVVGVVGDDQHLEYLAVGDSVNLASRLQSAAQPGKVLISASTAHLLGNTFELTDLGDIAVKGKAEPVHVYEVLQAAELTSPRGLVGLKSTLVGREVELSSLLAELERLEQGSGGIFFILGEAGIGKSRLVEEARRESPPGLCWLEGRNLSYGSTLSYWAITQLILDDLGLSDADPPLRRRVALRKRIETLLPDRVEDSLPALEYLLGVGEEGDAAQQMASLGGEGFKHQLLQVVGAYFHAMADTQPLVLVLEDIHWADASTLELVDSLLALTNRAPLFLLLIGRLDRAHGSWQLKFHAETDYGHRYHELQLAPLGSAESQQLVDNLLAISELPQELRHLIVERSDGNPFYLEELLRSLIDHGDLVQEDGSWQLSRDLDQLEIPETLQGVLLARLDRLEEDVRQTLQLAAVIGRSFLYRLLQAISEAEQELDRHLDELQRVDLVRENARLPELEYIFKHSLTQEAAYHSLLLERRRDFHYRVAIELERLFAGRREEFAGLLAHHYDLAGEREKALENLLLAGDNARLINAFEEAQQYYHRALELQAEFGDAEGEALTWMKLGLVHQTEFQFEQSHQAYEKAFELRYKAREQASELPAYTPPEGKPRLLRIGFAQDLLPTLDPGRSVNSGEVWLDERLYAGLAAYDSETNIVPHIARSWEVLDGGRRYLFHLRDDVLWSDGTRLTAHDFEWAWKRNLIVGGPEYPASILDDIRGARPFRMGQTTDPHSIGVHAMDPNSLEVELETPVAYFIYLIAHPIAYPLPRQTIEKFGDNWWRPDNIISNGPFRLKEYSSTALRMVRNPTYFGEFPGNLDGFEIEFFDFNDPARVTRFLEGKLDVAPSVLLKDSPVPVPDGLQFPYHIPTTSALVFNPSLPPTDNVRVRRALAQGVDFDQLNKYHFQDRDPHRQGGILPVGIAGYSPELGLPFDLQLARRQLAEAGFPGGMGFPVLKFGFFARSPAWDEFFHQLEINLGIQAEYIPITFPTANDVLQNLHMTAMNWMADYPDPDNFLRQSQMVTFPKEVGWKHARFDQLIDEASKSRHRDRRLALYREADRILVQEEAIIIPLSHGTHPAVNLIHPWVKGFEQNALGKFFYQNMRLERES